MHLHKIVLHIVVLDLMKAPEKCFQTSQLGHPYVFLSPKKIIDHKADIF